MEKRRPGLQTVTRVGFWAALLAFVANVGYDSVQILQVVNIPTHPWSDALIYGTSLCIATPFVVAMVALHHRTEED